MTNFESSFFFFGILVVKVDIYNTSYVEKQVNLNRRDFKIILIFMCVYMCMYVMYKCVSVCALVYGCMCKQMYVHVCLHVCV